MSLQRLRGVVFLLLLVIAFSCDKEDPVSPFVVNNSVKPVDFLTNNTYTSLNIELAWVDGYEPTTSAMNHLVTFLNERLNKSGGVTVTQRTIPSAGRLTMDIDVVREVEKNNRKSVTSGKTLSMWIVFLDAEYSESTDTQKVLGVAYGASSIAVFQKSVYTYTPRDMVSRYALETFILTHETCHILGLVNNGIPMVSPHQDTEHGAHCSDTDCLMYWKAESNLKLNDLLGEDDLPVLDASCLADLKAAGGK